MARGQADFGALAVKEVSASISDMGEVAARLGSIVIYDKRGDVVFFETFEEPVLRWDITKVEAESYARLDNSNVRSGSQAVKLHTANVNEEEVKIASYFAPLASKRLGGEISFSKLSTRHELYIGFNIYDGTYFKQPWINISYPNNKLYVRNEAGIFVEVAAMPGIRSDDFLFHTTKFVFDLDTDKYERWMLNIAEYDISTFSFKATGFETAPYIEFFCSVINTTSTGADLWVDDYILTQAEP